MDKNRANEQLSMLLQRSSSGDDQAFQELYGLVHRRVYLYLFRMLGNRESAEDVLVETFTATWKNAGKFASRSTVTTWIIGIARNLALNELRSRKIFKNLDDYPHIAGGPIPDMESSDRNRIIGLAMAKLSAKHREVLDLSFFHQLTYPEISTLLGIPVGTVKTRVYHAKAAIRSALARMKVDADAI